MSSPRPLSPHLEIYDAQITSGMSLTHRFTGIALAGGLVALVAWLACLAVGEEAYTFFMELLKSPLGQFCLFGWTWSIFIHMACGVRHLVWNFGIGFSLPVIYRSATGAIVFSILATLLVWLPIWLG